MRPTVLGQNNLLPKVKIRRIVKQIMPLKNFEGLWKSSRCLLYQCQDTDSFFTWRGWYLALVPVWSVRQEGAIGDRQASGFGLGEKAEATPPLWFPKILAGHCRPSSRSRLLPDSSHLIPAVPGPYRPIITFFFWGRCVAHRAGGRGATASADQSL